jgi:hypothetical protein
MSTTIVLIITLIAIFLLYRYIERRLNDIERRLSSHQIVPEINDEQGDDNFLNRISKKIDAIKEMCSPLLLLNIFDENESLTVGNDVYLTWLTSEFEQAEKTRIAKITAVDRTEKAELEQYEKEHPDRKDFVPSDDLKSAILAASAAIVIRQTIYDLLQAIKEIFFDVISGKLSIKEARGKAKEIAGKKDYKDLYLQNAVHSAGYSNPDTINEDTDNPRIKKEYKDFFDMHEKHWKNDKWKERLKWHKEMEKYEKGD